MGCGKLRGERKGTRTVGVEPAGKAHIAQPRATPLPPRDRATHTLYGSRGSDVSVILKETFDLRKREGELWSGSGTGDWGWWKANTYMVQPVWTQTPRQLRPAGPLPLRRLAPLKPTSPSASRGPPRLLLSKALPENRV